MFRVEHLDHVALTVSDLNRSVAWYRDVLGLERRHEEVWGDCPAMMCAGNTGVALFPAGARSPAPSPDPGKTIAMRHLAFRVGGGDFEAAQAELRRRGIRFEFQDHEISRSIYFHDPDGHEIELTSYDLA